MYGVYVRISMYISYMCVQRKRTVLQNRSWKDVAPAIVWKGCFMNEVFGMSPTWNANIPSQRARLYGPGFIYQRRRGRHCGDEGVAIDVAPTNSRQRINNSYWVSKNTFQYRARSCINHNVMKYLNVLFNWWSNNFFLQVILIFINVN